MHAKGSRWVFVAGLAWPLACGGEVRRNGDPSTSPTVSASVEGAGASGTTWSNATSVTGAAAVSAVNSMGTVGSASAAAAVTATSEAASSLGGAGGVGLSSGFGGGSAVDSSAGGASVSAGGASVSAGGAGGVSIGGTGGSVVPSCTHPEELEVGGVPTGFYVCDEGHEVRAEQVSCPNLLPAKGEGGGAGAGAECTSHADCSGLDYCALAGPFGPWCMKGCQTDADCEPGAICRCADPIGVCSEASCTTDADCEPGSFCAGVVDHECVTVHRYACQTAEDACQSDGDCSQEGRGEWCTLVEGVRRCETQRPCR